MKIILTAVGSMGDVYPFLAIAKLLRARTSYDVVFIANERFQVNAQFERIEFHAHSTKADYEMSFIPPEGNLKNPITLLKAVNNLMTFNFFKPMKETFNLIRELQTKDTLLIAHGASFGARLARDACNIPMISEIFSPTAVPGNRYNSFGAILSRIGSALCTKHINQFCRENSLPAIKSVDGWSLSPDRIAALFPVFLDPDKGKWPKEVSEAGYQAYTTLQNGEIVEEVRKFINDDPVLLFTPGTPIRFAKRFFSEAAELCRSLKRKGIFVTDYADQVPEKLPDYIKHLSYVPFRQVFPMCEMIVHHGGIGTSMECLLAGKPQLVVPQTADQPFNAARLKELNVADSISFGKFTARKAKEKALRLINDRVVLNSCRNMKRMVELEDPENKMLQIIQSAIREYVL